MVSDAVRVVLLDQQPVVSNGERKGGERRTGVGVSVLITLPGDVVLVGDIGTQELIEGRKKKKGLVFV